MYRSTTRPSAPGDDAVRRHQCLVTRLRRDQASVAPEVRSLRDALEGGETVVTTGLVLRHELTLLTTDKDFEQAAPHCALRVWQEDR